MSDDRDGPLPVPWSNHHPDKQNTLPGQTIINININADDLKHFAGSHEHLNFPPYQQGHYYGGFPYSRRGGGIGFFGRIFYFFYVCKSIIKMLLIVGILVLIVTIIFNPNFMINVWEGILKKTGLWKVVLQIRRLLGK